MGDFDLLIHLALTIPFFVGLLIGFVLGHFFTVRDEDK